MPLCDKLTVVVHQVRSPDNLGAIARLMANFGLAGLSLSDPVTQAFEDAQKMAVKSEHVLRGLKVFSTLPEALEKCVWACGTTSRQTVQRRAVLSPEEAIRRLSQKAEEGPVALVFGGERHGLSDDDLAHCQDILAIATQPPQPSMNLAQSAAVLLYLCTRAQASQEAEGPEAEEPRAPLALLQRLRMHLQNGLAPTGFLNPQAPRHVLNELWQTLARANLTQREAELWIAALKQVERCSRASEAARR